MPCNYCVRRKVDKTIQPEKVSYYPILQSEGLIDSSELAVEISDRCVLSPGDVRASIIELQDSILEKLKAGYSVRLKGIGVFSLSLTGDGVDFPEACTPKTVRANRICFKADKELKRELNKIEFKKV